MSNVTKICNAKNDLFWKRSIISHICHKVRKIFSIITKNYVRFVFSFYSRLIRYIWNINIWYFQFLRFRKKNWRLKFVERSFCCQAYVDKWSGNKTNRILLSLCSTQFCLSHGVIVMDVNCFWETWEKSTKSRSIKTYTI